MLGALGNRRCGSTVRASTAPSRGTSPQPRWPVATRCPKGLVTSSRDLGRSREGEARTTVTTPVPVRARPGPAGAGTPVIETDALTKQYTREVTALDRLSVSI